MFTLTDMLMSAMMSFARDCPHCTEVSTSVYMAAFSPAGGLYQTMCTTVIMLGRWVGPGTRFGGSSQAGTLI
jgi:hypothetical protein